MMKKLIYLTLIFSLFLSCGKRQEKVERIIEDGAEVVVNHLEPYKIKGEPNTLHLEEEFTIDPEKDELAEIGLGEFAALDVDSDGNIYFWNQDGPDAFIFKFDRDGNFVTSFGRKGQGPGELQFLTYLRISGDDEIMITDSRRRRLIIFNQDGRLIKEIPLDFRPLFIIPLYNRKYLVRSRQVNPKAEYFLYPTLIYNSNLEIIKELTRGKVPNYRLAKRIEAIRRGGIIGVTKKCIYLTSSSEGYEICVYDLEGNLLRKIRKEYEPVPITEEDEEKIKKRNERYPEEIRRKVYIPKSKPPFQYGFVDDNERLYVMTYEKGENLNEYKYDIFNADGIYFGETYLENYGQYGPSASVLFAMAKREHIYCIRQKESGFKELVVYKMNWGNYN